MTKEEFKPVFVKLCNYYGKQATSELADIYYSILKEMTIINFRKKCKGIIKINTFMPKVSEFFFYDKDGNRNEGIRVRTKEFDDMTEEDFMKFYYIGGTKNAME